MSYDKDISPEELRDLKRLIRTRRFGNGRKASPQFISYAKVFVAYLIELQNEKPRKTRKNR